MRWQDLRDPGGCLRPGCWSAGSSEGKWPEDLGAMSMRDGASRAFIEKLTQLGLGSYKTVRMVPMQLGWTGSLIHLCLSYYPRQAASTFKEKMHRKLRANAAPPIELVQDGEGPTTAPGWAVLGWPLLWHCSEGQQSHCPSGDSRSHSPRAWACLRVPTNKATCRGRWWPLRDRLFPSRLTGSLRHTGRGVCREF